MNIEEMTIKDAREIASMFGNNNSTPVTTGSTWKHPFIGKRVLVRTYSDGDGSGLGSGYGTGYDDGCGYRGW